MFPANLAFFYPLATNMGKPDIHTYFDVGLLYTRVGSVDGLQASAMAARVDGPVNGVQAAGIASYASRVQGLQASGIANYASQVGGSSVFGDCRGRRPRRTRGAARVHRQHRWRQRERRSERRGQCRARRRRGAAGHRQRGAQIRGLQLGIVNVADDVDGVAIGVASISKTGHISAQSFATGASDNATFDLSVKFATKYFHTLVGAPTTAPTEKTWRATPSGSAGQIPLSERCLAELDLIASDLWRRHPSDEPGFEDPQIRFSTPPRRGLPFLTDDCGAGRGGAIALPFTTISTAIPR